MHQMVLRGTKHLKKIYEKFAKGNLWCILHFDCKMGYEEAKSRFENEKEEYEQLNLILEETPRERTNISKEIKQKEVEGTESQSKSKRERQAKLELEEIERKRRKLSTEQNKLEEKNTKDKGKGKIVYKEERLD